jgi:hypothetical protein
MGTALMNRSPRIAKLLISVFAAAVGWLRLALPFAGEIRRCMAREEAFDYRWQIGS